MVKNSSKNHENRIHEIKLTLLFTEQDKNIQELFSSPNLTLDELEEAVNVNVKARNYGSNFTNMYAFSKAALCSLTMIHGKAYPNLKVVSVSPGFVATPMTKGFGAKATAEQGCVSIIKCLFAPVTSGYFYGSDGLRSPLTISRDPGTQEYKGEENPDPAKYSIKYV